MKSMKGKTKIIIAIVLVCLLFFLGSNEISAAINSEYGTTTSVAGGDVSSDVSKSSLLGLLSRLVFALGRMIEWLTSLIFQALTRVNDFPWADKIVFNAVPLLDVNFINPDRGSFLGNDAIVKVIRNLYSTILALAVSFFGIVVMVTAIKLVISTIAEEKAKYKKAVVDWLVGFVMLFCIHFLISFIFYLNESLVKVASQIAVAQYGKAEEKIKAQNSEFAKQIIKNVGDTVFTLAPEGTKYYGEEVKIADILTEVPGMLEAWTNFPADDGTYGLHEMLMKKTGDSKDKAISGEQQIQRLGLIFAWAIDENISVTKLREIANNQIIGFQTQTSALRWKNGEAITTPVFNEIFGTYVDEMIVIMADASGTQQLRVRDVEFVKNDRSTKEYFNSLPKDMVLVLSRGLAGIANKKDYESDWDGDWDQAIKISFAWHTVLEELIKLKSYSSTAYYNANASEDDNANASEDDKVAVKNVGVSYLISDLSRYFKTNAYERKMESSKLLTAATKTDNIYPQNMIMFTVLTVQSIILFIAYIKRLFYVVLLGLMAPVVVVFDFFQRFGK